MDLAIHRLIEHLDENWVEPDAAQRLCGLVTTDELARVIYNHPERRTSPEDCLYAAYSLCVRAISKLAVDNPPFSEVNSLLITAFATSIRHRKTLAVLAKWYQAMTWTLRSFPGGRWTEDKATLNHAIELFGSVIKLAHELGDSFRMGRAYAMIAELKWWQGKLHQARQAATLALYNIAAANKHNPGLSDDMNTWHCLTVGRELITANASNRPSRTEFILHLYVPGELLATDPETV